MTKPTQIGEIKRSGGWHGHPNSLRNLQNRVLLQHQRKCSRCRRVAVRGRKVCLMHGGREHSSLAFGRAESRQLARLEGLGLLPLDLIALPVWRGLMGLPTAQRAPLRLALVMAWDKRLVSPVNWAAIQRQALDLAARPGWRRITVPWYENR